MKRSTQSGALAAIVVVVLFLVAAAVVAVWLLNRTSDQAALTQTTANSLAKAMSALANFAATTQRLPCPADPANDDGVEVRVALAADCGKPLGTLPWKTIGLRAEDALDAWGRKISYRAYTGNAGSLTQDEGASTVKCDLNPTFPDGLTPAVANAGTLCKDNHRSKSTDFFAAGKGLPVTDDGAPVTDAAYVLISHGPTGLGAYLPGGGRKLPLPANVDEVANIQQAGPFVARSPVTLGLSPEDANFFDDVLRYERLPNLIQRANLQARSWKDTDAGAGVTLNAATMQAAIGSSAAGDTGQQTITFSPNARVTAFDGGGNQNIAFAASGGNEGIGGVNGGSNGLSDTGGEGLRLELSAKARFFGITLNDFGTLPVGLPPSWKEQVEFRFIDSTTSSVRTIVKVGCHDDGGLASFTKIDPGIDFDSIEIRALVSTADPVLGTTVSTAFFVSAFRTCGAGATLCASPLEAPGNLCS